jgi:hypothetical protein
VWNGSLAQALSFQSNAQISYPVLRNAGTVTNSYATGYEYVYVIGGDGRVTYRNLAGWNDSEVLAAVQSAVDDLVGTPAPPSAGRAARLAVPSPNPFNPRTSLTLELPSGDVAVTLEVYDQRGRRVRSLLDGEVLAGPRYDVVWDGRDDMARDLASGVYFFRMQAADQVSVQKGTLVR